MPSLDVTRLVYTFFSCALCIIWWFKKHFKVIQYRKSVNSLIKNASISLLNPHTWVDLLKLFKVYLLTFLLNSSFQSTERKNVNSKMAKLSKDFVHLPLKTWVLNSRSQCCRYTHSFCKLDHFRITEKMFPIMKWTIIQKEWVNLFQNIFTGLALGGQCYRNTAIIYHSTFYV
jgi:hypothetical protein